MEARRDGTEARRDGTEARRDGMFNSSLFTPKSYNIFIPREAVVKVAVDAEEQTPRISAHRARSFCADLPEFR